MGFLLNYTFTDPLQTVPWATGSDQKNVDQEPRREIDTARDQGSLLGDRVWSVPHDGGAGQLYSDWGHWSWCREQYSTHQ